jgi:alkylation response protein AidB-like acyl-CoA dehydrogenase
VAFSSWATGWLCASIIAEGRRCHGPFRAGGACPGAGFAPAACPSAGAGAHAFALTVKDSAAERDRARILPIAEIERFSATGLWGLNVPRAYGGPEQSWVTIAEVIRIVSAADPSVGQIPQNHYAFLNLLRAEPDEARKQYFFG